MRHQVEADLGQGFLDALRAPQRPPIEALLTSLINQIDALDDGLILLLDD